MSDLAVLLVALDSGASLPWAIRNIGSSGADAALLRAWDAERVPEALFDTLGHAGDVESQCRANDARNTFYESASHYGALTCDCVLGGTYLYGACVHCCAAIRASVPCPTWAALTRGAK